MTEPIRLFTIGFTQKSARTFFGLLRTNHIKTVVDTRLNNTGQLAGFSKKDDLAYFASELCGSDYLHFVESAPTDELLKAYKGKKLSWADYAREYAALIGVRRVEKLLDKGKLDYGCLLCSEAKPHHCHRSILAEYFKTQLDVPVEIKHL
jgi:uncharacterized protein (DUF488 family)